MEFGWYSCASSTSTQENLQAWLKLKNIKEHLRCFADFFQLTRCILPLMFFALEDLKILQGPSLWARKSVHKGGTIQVEALSVSPLRSNCQPLPPPHRDYHYHVFPLTPLTPSLPKTFCLGVSLGDFFILPSAVTPSPSRFLSLCEFSPLRPSCLFFLCFSSPRMVVGLHEPRVRSDVHANALSASRYRLEEDQDWRFHLWPSIGPSLGSKIANEFVWVEERVKDRSTHWW